jgi:hypothetical protein
MIRPTSLCECGRIANAHEREGHPAYHEFRPWLTPERLKEIRDRSWVEGEDAGLLITANAIRDIVDSLIAARGAVEIARSKGEHYPVCDSMPPTLRFGTPAAREWFAEHRPRGGGCPFCNCWKAEMERAAEGEGP